jgi:hypothetical protein
MVCLIGLILLKKWSHKVTPEIHLSSAKKLYEEEEKVFPLLPAFEEPARVSHSLHLWQVEMPWPEAGD